LVNTKEQSTFTTRYSRTGRHTRNVLYAIVRWIQTSWWNLRKRCVNFLDLSRLERKAAHQRGFHQVNGHIQKRNITHLEDCKQSREEWTNEVGRLQALLPVEETRDKLRDEELPSMKKRVNELDEKAVKATAEAQEVRIFNYRIRMSEV
jgi:hypothetical protein